MVTSNHSALALERNWGETRTTGSATSMSVLHGEGRGRLPRRHYDRGAGRTDCDVAGAAIDFERNMHRLMKVADPMPQALEEPDLLGRILRQWQISNVVEDGAHHTAIGLAARLIAEGRAARSVLQAAAEASRRATCRIGRSS